MSEDEEEPTELSGVGELLDLLTATIDRLDIVVMRMETFIEEQVRRL